MNSERIANQGIDKPAISMQSQPSDQHLLSSMASCADGASRSATYRHERFTGLDDWIQAKMLNRVLVKRDYS